MHAKVERSNGRALIHGPGFVFFDRLSDTIQDKKKAARRGDPAEQRHLAEYLEFPAW